MNSQLIGPLSANTMVGVRNPRTAHCAIMLPEELRPCPYEAQR